MIAEIPYPVIDPVIVGPLRWYGVSYIAAFALAFLVLRMLSRRGRWPVPPDRVGDVLFWGILGVFLGGRIGYMVVYADDKSFLEWFKVRDGGMSFHGGMVGVIFAYFMFSIVRGIRFRDLGDGLALATPLGIFCVRIANFINAELWGRPWDGPWSMRFPIYKLGSPWDGRWDSVTRHPSQLYEAVLEGPVLFGLLWFLMLGRGWGGGRIGSVFLLGYGGFRFCTEFFREPDAQLGYQWLGMTRGQELCAAMFLVGLVFLALTWRSTKMETPPWAKAPA